MSKSIIGYSYKQLQVATSTHLQQCRKARILTACRWLKATQMSKCQNVGPCALQLEFSINEFASSFRPQTTIEPMIECHSVLDVAM